MVLNTLVSVALLMVKKPMALSWGTRLSLWTMAETSPELLACWMLLRDMTKLLVFAFLVLKFHILLCWYQPVMQSQAVDDIFTISCSEGQIKENKHPVHNPCATIDHCGRFQKSIQNKGHHHDSRWWCTKHQHVYGRQCFADVIIHVTGGNHMIYVITDGFEILKAINRVGQNRAYNQKQASLHHTRQTY